ncbi:MAG: cell division protein ZapA [Alphaproteobacteria bacterium]|nr:cell division protein ZapA [Alphaproteobacteria bacterium]
MAELDITICGRAFRVACQPGGEDALIAAARMLDAEAVELTKALGRMPDVTMMLMAGLVLADRAIAQEAELSQVRAQAAALANRPPPWPERIEVPVIPPEVTETLAELAARAEALAAELEERAVGPLG